ncbi:MAG: hypothetical protein KIS66_10780 [Fimbriimonadaceae bacterium]|nr:hypothetical protein [Fimbriimonadaceae bacterium]
MAFFAPWRRTAFLCWATFTVLAGVVVVCLTSAGLVAAGLVAAGFTAAGLVVPVLPAWAETVPMEATAKTAIRDVSRAKRFMGFLVEPL